MWHKVKEMLQKISIDLPRQRLLVGSPLPPPEISLLRDGEFRTLALG
jgi:hypothetical protein